MISTTAQEVKRVPRSEDLLHPGDFVFIPKRESVETYCSVPIPPPAGFFAHLKWFFGPKTELKFEETPVWPDADTVITTASPATAVRHADHLSLSPDVHLQGRRREDHARPSQHNDSDDNGLSVHPHPPNIHSPSNTPNPARKNNKMVSMYVYRFSADVTY